MDDPIPANEPQLGSVSFTVAVIVSPRPIDLAPESGGDAPQTHAWASLT